MKSRTSRTDHVMIRGIRLEVPPSVFHPSLYRSSEVLLESLAKLQIKNKSLLDMGTGTGLIAIAAAHLGAYSQGVDINPVAVSCARNNASRNNLSNLVSFKESDLFSSFNTTEKFDFIVWNPPFYSGMPTDIASAAWMGGDGLATIQRFIEAASSYLKSSGQLILLFSSDMEENLVHRMLSHAGFTGTLIHSKRFMFETVTVFAFTQKMP